MPEEIIITPEASVVYSAGIRKDNPNYSAALKAAKLYLGQGASFDTAVGNVKAQFSTTSSGTTPTTPTTKQPGENRLTINEFGAIANASKTPNSELVSRIMAQTGLPESNVRDMLDAAAAGNANAMATLAALGVEPYATMAANKAGSGDGGGSGGGGGGISAPSPYEDVKTRQALALFDPNYPDGALIPLPDGTSRINGTEIIIDGRAKGQFKPVVGADGYLVDPTTGTIIDLNGNQILRSQLEETIRSNKATEAISMGDLALRSVIGPGELNLQAATSENEQALKNQLETSGLNLESFLGTGKLNIGATDAETNRLNALTSRTSNAGTLATDLQQLQDARTQAVIALMANPQDFVEREYATRALNTPPGYTGPAFRDNPQIQQIIDELRQTPDVGGLLPEYTAPTFAPAILPNATLPRVTAPPLPGTKQANTDISGQVYTNTNVTPENQAASQHFREVGVPDWALAPLGYAHGTDGTKERSFVVGDPQADQNWQETNPEQVDINNPGPNTTATVTSLRGIMGHGNPMQSGQANMEPATMDNNSSSNDGLSELIAGILIAVSNKWSAKGEGMAKYAYGTNSMPDFTKVREAFSGNPNIPEPVQTKLGNVFDTVQNTIGSRQQVSPPTTPTNPQPTENTTSGMFSRYLASRRPTWDITPPNNPATNPSTNPSTNPHFPAWWNPQEGDFGSWIQQLMSRFSSRLSDNQNTLSRFPNNQNTLGINPRMDKGGMSYYAYGTGNTPTSNNANVDAQGNYAGTRDYAGNPLGTLTSYPDKAIREMPNIQYAQNAGNANAYNTLNTGQINGPFGSRLPDVGGLNYSQLLNIAQDPDSWGTLSSIYRAGNRNLEGMLARIRARAPIGNVIDRSLIRTGG